MEEKEIRQKAIDFLASREHSFYELQQKLQARGANSDSIDDVLNGLKQKGWQSDIRFTEQYIQSRLRRGFGPLRITGELHQRGVDDRIVKQGLEQAEIDWVVYIRAVRNKKFGSTLPTNWDDKAKQMRYLQQRGFTHEQINKELKTD